MDKSDVSKKIVTVLTSFVILIFGMVFYSFVNDISIAAAASAAGAGAGNTALIIGLLPILFALAVLSAAITVGYLGFKNI